MGLHPSEIVEMIKYCEVWWLNLELQLRNLHDGKEGNKERECFFLIYECFLRFLLVACKQTFYLSASLQPEVFLIDEL